MDLGGPPVKEINGGRSDAPTLQGLAVLQKRKGTIVYEREDLIRETDGLKGSRSTSSE